MLGGFWYCSDSNEEVQVERGGDVQVLQAQGRGRVREEHGEGVLGVRQQLLLVFYAVLQSVLKGTHTECSVRDTSKSATTCAVLAERGKYVPLFTES